MTATVDAQRPPARTAAKGAGITLVALPGGRRRWVPFVITASVVAVLAIIAAATLVLASSDDTTNVAASGPVTTAVPTRAAVPVPTPQPAAPASTSSTTTSSTTTTAVATTTTVAPTTSAATAPPPAQTPPPATAPAPPPPPPAPPPLVEAAAHKVVSLISILGANCSTTAQQGIPKRGEFDFRLSRAGDLWSMTTSKGRTAQTTNPRSTNVSFPFPPVTSEPAPGLTVTTQMTETFNFVGVTIDGENVTTYSFTGVLNGVDLTGQACTATFDVTGTTSVPLDDATILAAS